MEERLINAMSLKYADYEIEPNILLDLCNKMLKKTQLPKKISINMDYYYYYYFIFKNMIDNYIIEEIKKGNTDYEVYLLLQTEYIVDRYYNIRKDKIKSDNIEDYVLEECLNNYNEKESFDKQVVKRLHNK